jgi:hypothetical protein
VVQLWLVYSSEMPPPTLIVGRSGSPLRPHLSKVIPGRLLQIVLYTTSEVMSQTSMDTSRIRWSLNCAKKIGGLLPQKKRLFPRHVLIQSFNVPEKPSEPFSLQMSDRKHPWVSRVAIAGGVIPHTFEPALEYDFRRTPHAFTSRVYAAGWSESEDRKFPDALSFVGKWMSIASFLGRSTWDRTPMRLAGSTATLALDEPRQITRLGTTRSMSREVVGSSVGQTLEQGGHYRLVEADNVEIWHGRVITDGQTFATLQNWSDPRKPTRGVSLIEAWQESPGTVNSSALVLEPWLSSETSESALFFGGSRNWWHFMYDFLPRLCTLQSSGHAIPLEIVVSEDLDEAALSAIRLLAPKSRVLVAGLGSRIRVDHAMFVEQHSVIPSNRLIETGSAEALAWIEALKRLANSLLDATDRPIRHEQLGRVFVRRGPNGFRPLRNASGLQSQLENSGFTTVETTSLNMQQRRAIFAEARVLVAEYGAAFGNLIFCQPGTIVIDLRGPSLEHDLTAANLCALLGLRYIAVLGERARFSREGFASDGFSVSGSQLRQVLHTNT